MRISKQQTDGWFQERLVDTINVLNSSAPDKCLFIKMSKGSAFKDTKLLNLTKISSLNYSVFWILSKLKKLVHSFLIV